MSGTTVVSEMWRAYDEIENLRQFRPRITANNGSYEFPRTDHCHEQRF